MSEIFVTRQPVYDRASNAVAYELRYQDSEESTDVFVASYLNGSFELLRSGLPAWVRPTRQAITDGVFDAAEPSDFTMLLPPDMATDDHLVTGVRRLAEKGMRVAIDGFVLPEDSAAPICRLLQTASMVRIDLRQQNPEALVQMLKTLKAMGKRVVADHVDDSASYNACIAAGFDALQGLYFSRPEPLPLAQLPSSTMIALRLLALARDFNTPERELESTISADPGITYQLLRIANSAAVGGHGITSIQHALRLIGRANLVRWLGVASAASHRGSTGVTCQLVLQALQRARFCESLAVPANGLDRGTLFMMGLISLLDAVFRVPMFEILDRINLAPEVKNALLERSGPYADPLVLIESYELGLWQGAAAAAERLGFDPARLASCYGDSVQWAAEQMPGSGSTRVVVAS
jgi:EAL and modified HD-GYP domain-containing signal transduction protein